MDQFWPSSSDADLPNSSQAWRGIDDANVLTQQANRGYEGTRVLHRSAFRNSLTLAAATIGGEGINQPSTIQTTGSFPASNRGFSPSATPSDVYRHTSYQPPVDSLAWSQASPQASTPNYSQFLGVAPIPNPRPVNVNVTAATYRPAVHADTGGVNLNRLSTFYNTSAQVLPTTDTWQSSHFDFSAYSTQESNSTNSVRDGPVHNISTIQHTTDFAFGALNGGFLGHPNQIHHESEGSFGSFDEQTFAQPNDASYDNPSYTAARLSNPLNNNSLRNSVRQSLPHSFGDVNQTLPENHNGNYRQLDTAYSDKTASASVSTKSPVGAEFEHIVGDDVRRNDVRRRRNPTSVSSSVPFSHPYYASRPTPSVIPNTSQIPAFKRSKPVQTIRVRAMNNQHNQPKSVPGSSPLEQQRMDSAKPVDGTDFTSVYLRALNAKQPRIGQRGKFNLEWLQAIFPDQLGLKALLESILSSPWFYEDEPEPQVGSTIGEQLLVSVCQVASDDRDFCARVEGMLGLPEEVKQNMSVYEVFKEPRTGNCLFCKAAKGRQECFLGHVRSHLEHRPYGCEVGVGTACKVCNKDGIRRRFYSSKLLQQHQKKPTKRVTCKKCFTSVQEAGAVRHLNAVHDIVTKCWAPYFTVAEPSTPLSQ